MAEYRLGKAFPVTVDGLLLVCKTSFDLTLSNEGTIIQNDCTDEYGHALPGGNKTGSFTAEADLDFDANQLTTMSWHQLVTRLGLVSDIILNDVNTSGETLIVFSGRLDGLTLTGSTNERITFNVTFNLSGTPELINIT